MFNIGASLISSLSTILALKALPDEEALQCYMRNAFRGIFFLILGSVLLGATITAFIYIAYDQLISYGYNRTSVQIISISVALILVITSFILANKWLSGRLCVKEQSKSTIDEKIDHVKNFVSASIDGFIEGFFQKPKDRK